MSSNSLMNFNEIFGENVTYKYLKNHQKSGFQLLSRKMSLENPKTISGVGC